MHEHINDPWVQRAKKEGYRSRASYKLLEIAKKDKLLRQGITVVDLGAAPGGWSQVVAREVGHKGKVIAIDLLEMSPVVGVTFIQADFTEQAGLDALKNALNGQLADLVLSDMAPNISGIQVSDQARAMHLVELALEFTTEYLKPGGDFLVKLFQGAGFEEYLRALRARFTKVSSRKPEASRGRSNEIYLLARGKK